MGFQDAGGQEPEAKSGIYEGKESRKKGRPILPHWRQPLWKGDLPLSLEGFKDQGVREQIQ